jgi:hypothetical protein
VCLPERSGGGSKRFSRISDIKTRPGVVLVYPRLIGGESLEELKHRIGAVGDLLD